ncbi:MAG: AI-2E family transporter [Pseudanabaenaceae cyanobacterium]
MMPILPDSSHSVHETMNPDRSLQRLLVIGLTFPLIVLNGWLALVVMKFFQPFTSIFIAAAILAFLLNYAVEFLTAQGVKRNNAVAVVSLLALSVIALIAFFVVPIALGQLNDLVKRFPSLIESGIKQLQTLQAWAESQNIPLNITGLAVQAAGRLSGEIQNLSGKAISLVLDTAGNAFKVLLTLVLTFYLLLNGKNLWEGLFRLLPPRIGMPIQRSLRENFQNYYIGQVTLASLNGTLITLAFLALKVPFGVLFGVGIAVMGIIPFAGALTVTIITILVALQNFWLGLKVLITVLAIDQAMNNLVAPRILGELTGLEPALILISLLVGLQVAGPLGLIIAVPLASSCKSLLDELRNSTNRAEATEQKLLETTAP